MQLKIPSHEIEKLTQHATAAGFGSVESYVTQFVLALAERPNTKEVFAPLKDDELAASLAMIDRGIAEIGAGQGMSLDEARRRTRENIGAGNE